MRQKLSENQFNSLLKYAVSNGDNPNCDRCYIIDVIVDDVKYSLTICFNEKKQMVCICEVFKIIESKIAEVEVRSSEENSDVIRKACFDEILRLALGDWSINENDKWKFYKEKIEPKTECCELNQ
jgi:hypothetical protein